MKIYELAQKAGLTTPTIRFYEQEVLLDTRHVRREENNYRNYCEGAVEHLLILRKFQVAGFTLAEFKELVQADKANELPLQKVVEILRQKMEEIERGKAELEHIQMYLTQMLEHKMALIDAEEKRDAQEEYQHSAHL